MDFLNYLLVVGMCSAVMCGIYLAFKKLYSYLKKKEEVAALDWAKKTDQEKIQAQLHTIKTMLGIILLILACRLL